MKMYRNIGIPEMFVVWKTGKVFPTLFEENDDSLAPGGEWSFWLDEKVLISTTASIMVEAEVASSNYLSSLMYSVIYGEDIDEECVNTEYIVNCPIKVKVTGLCNWVKELTPFELEGYFNGLEIEGNLWDEMEEFISWLNEQKTLPLLDIYYYGKN